MSNIIDTLNWRYATKIFDKNKKVKKEDLDEVIEAFRLTASSYWLQPWKLLVIENQKVKESLVEQSYWQPQISDSSHLFVLCRITNLDEKFVDKYIDSIAKTREMDKKDLAWFHDILKWFVSNMDDVQKIKWTSNQVYIPLWNLLNVLATKKIDACPMEWFSPAWYDKILNLKEKWLESVALISVWYRSEADQYAKAKKVRFASEEVVEVI